MSTSPIFSGLPHSMAAPNFFSPPYAYTTSSKQPPRFELLDSDMPMSRSPKSLSFSKPIEIPFKPGQSYVSFSPNSAAAPAALKAAATWDQFARPMPLSSSPLPGSSFSLKDEDDLQFQFDSDQEDDPMYDSEPSSPSISPADLSSISASLSGGRSSSGRQNVTPSPAPTPGLTLSNEVAFDEEAFNPVTTKEEATSQYVSPGTSPDVLPLLTATIQSGKGVLTIEAYPRYAIADFMTDSPRLPKTASNSPY